jgi:hypothetical protein
MNDQEFYVGYISETPTQTASFVRKIVIGIGLMICFTAAILAWSQKRFSSSVFEYGVNTTLEGYFFPTPVPHIAIPLGSDPYGKEIFQNVMLVGYGKSGADEAIEALQKKNGQSLVGSRIELKGFLIYGNGKALLQIREEDNNNIKLSNAGMPPSLHLDSVIVQSVRGEIVDPKCYFGVMKPGEGKAHRSCAIRCIAGGIPPVFHAADSGEYFLLLDEDGQAINQDVLALVGDQINLTGREINWNDWKILKVNPEDLKRIAQEKKLTEQLLAFGEGVAMCTDKTCY